MLLFSHLRLCHPSGYIPSGLPTITLYASLLSIVHSSLLDYLNSILSEVKIIKFLIMRFPLITFNLFLLGRNIFLSTLPPNMLCIMFFPQRETWFHSLVNFAPYKQTSTDAISNYKCKAPHSHGVFAFNSLPRLFALLLTYSSKRTVIRQNAQLNFRLQYFDSIITCFSL
jgi:hypothetical protein